MVITIVPQYQNFISSSSFNSNNNSQNKKLIFPKLVKVASVLDDSKKIPKSHNLYLNECSATTNKP